RREAELPGALVLPYLNDALRMVASGYASAAAIDTGMLLGCRMPAPVGMLTDVGADEALQGERAWFAGSAGPSHRPSRLQESLAPWPDPAAASAELRAVR